MNFLSEEFRPGENQNRTVLVPFFREIESKLSNLSQKKVTDRIGETISVCDNVCRVTLK